MTKIYSDPPHPTPDQLLMEVCLKDKALIGQPSTSESSPATSTGVGLSFTPAASQGPCGPDTTATPLDPRLIRMAAWELHLYRVAGWGLILGAVINITLAAALAVLLVRWVLK
jgi:hypothetical protein